jgi:hypothetical protein
VSVPDGYEYGCEDCEFSTADEQAAFDHSDEHRHSLALRPLNVTHVPMSAWTLLPPAEGACPVCATKHAPEEPHNPDSLHWQTARTIAGAPMPTWADALEHVEEPLRAAWVEALAERGVVV